jgi:hypothetical protein
VSVGVDRFIEENICVGISCNCGAGSGESEALEPFGSARNCGFRLDAGENMIVSYEAQQAFCEGGGTGLLLGHAGSNVIVPLEQVVDADMNMPDVQIAVDPVDGGPMFFVLMIGLPHADHKPHAVEFAPGCAAFDAHGIAEVSR